MTDQQEKPLREPLFTLCTRARVHLAIHGFGGVNRKQLHELNLAIVKRILLWLLCTLVAAGTVAFCGMVLMLHLTGGTMLASRLNATGWAFALGVIVITAGISRHQVGCVWHWFWAVVAHRLKQRRERLEQEERGRS